MVWILGKEPGARQSDTSRKVTMNLKGKNSLQILVLVASVLAASVAGWMAQREYTGVWKTRNAYFMRLDDGRLECILRPSFVESIFGPDWRKQEIYIAHGGWIEDNSKVCIDSFHAPLKSLSLNYAMLNIEQPKGKRWDLDVYLYSRKSKIVCTLLVRMKAREVIIQKKGISKLPEKILPNGQITF